MADKDIDYYEVFGVDKPDEADKGEKEEQPADVPADTETDKGAKESEAAESSVDDEADEDEEDAQSNEDNARFAAMRRKAEADAGAKAAKERDKAIAEMGLTDDDGNEITTFEQFKAYKDSQAHKADEDKYADDYERYLDMGLSEEEAQEIIEAKKSAAKYKGMEKELQAAAERERKAAFDRQVAEELSFIREYDPSIKTVEDLPQMDNFEAFQSFVARGDNFITAYLKSHKGQAPAGRQTGSGKEHLKSTKTRGGGAIDVPEDVIRWYRDINGEDISRKEIVEHYRRHHKT